MCVCVCVCVLVCVWVDGWVWGPVQVLVCNASTVLPLALIGWVPAGDPQLVKRPPADAEVPSVA